MIFKSGQIEVGGEGEDYFTKGGFNYVRAFYTTTKLYSIFILADTVNGKVSPQHQALAHGDNFSHKTWHV